MLWQLREETMSADNERARAEITRIEFSRSVDRETLRQLAELNARGLRAIMTLGRSSSGRPALFSQIDDVAPQDSDWQRLGDAPFLMFEWRSLVDWQVNEAAETWREHAEWAGFARLAAHFSADICRNRRPAARLLLGMPTEQCEAWARLSLVDIDLRAQRASQQIDLRWSTDSRFWQRRLRAATLPGDEALWRNTLEGMQRLAALARPRG